MSGQKDAVLLVDDDPDVVWGIGKYLTRVGCSVTTCGDGGEAIDVMRDKSFDVLVTDIRMPHVNGLDLVDWVRRHRPGTRVVVMTAYGGPSVREVCLNKGAILYLEKPVDPEILHNVLDASRRKTAFSGSIEEIDILDYLQLLLLSGKRVVLEVFAQDGERALLYIDQGKISHASCGEVEGVDALYRSVGFEGGTFMNRPWMEPERVTIDKPGEFLLLEAARMRDEKRESFNTSEA